MSWGPLQLGRNSGQDSSPDGGADSGPDARAGGGATGTPARPGDIVARHLDSVGRLLAPRWAARPRFVVLATGFDLGQRFLATWQAWQDDPRRCERLVYLAVEPHPATAAQLLQALAPARAGARQARLAAELARGWPPRTPDLHLLDLDGGRVRLMLAFGAVDQVLPELVAQVDAFDLDGGAAPPPTYWDRYRLRLLARLAAPEATLISQSNAEGLRSGLRAAGFEAQADADGKGTVARFAPHFKAPPPPGRRSQPQARQVAVVGAGLAGAGAARALAAQGLAVAVFDQAPAAAQGSSGNPGGLFHGIVHGHDGPHARWLRAAALHCASVLAPWCGQAGPGAADAVLPGAVQGLLRGERALDRGAMQALLDRLGLPAEYVQVAQQRWPGGGPAWLYPSGGWVNPAALCRHWLAAPGIALHTGRAVARLEAAGAQWRLHDDEGRCLAEVDAVLLCNASDAWRLAGGPGGVAPGLAWPLRRVRGQVTLVQPGHPAKPTGPQQPGCPGGLPLADTGYALQLADGRWLCGATSQPGDEDPTLRTSDQARNLATLERLTGLGQGLDPTGLDGRVGWRVQSDDRLPLLGLVPAGPGQADGRSGPAPGRAHPAAAAQPRRRPDQARLVPRWPGLYVFTALGSRGISQAGLGGELLAAWLTGAPLPVPASLLDALDPARFIVRAARRQPAAGE